MNLSLGMAVAYLRLALIGSEFLGHCCWPSLQCLLKVAAKIGCVGRVEVVAGEYLDVLCALLIVLRVDVFCNV